MRLIDADVLKSKLYIENDNWNPIVTEKEIDETPTAFDIKSVLNNIREHSRVMSTKKVPHIYHRAIGTRVCEEIIKNCGLDKISIS